MDNAVLRQAMTAHRQGALDAAERLYGQAIAVEPDNAAAFFYFGLLHLARGRGKEALACFDRALALQPQLIDAEIARGGALRALGRREAALASCDRALALQPGHPELLSNRGSLLAEMARFEEALAAFARALALKPGNPGAWNNHGAVLNGLGRTAEALTSFDRAVALKPDFVEALRNRALMLHELGRLDEAVAGYDAALAARPDYGDAWNDRGRALLTLKRYDAALASFDAVLARVPGHAGALNNRGTLRWELRDIAGARADFDAAIAADPRIAEAWYNRGAMAGSVAKDYGAAIADLGQALARNPDYPFARGHLLHMKLYAGDWGDFAAQMAAIDAGVRADKPVAEPFVYQGLSHSPADLCRATRLYARVKFLPAPAVFTATRRKPGKIRLGYVCGEFREQATMFLSAGLYERHDRERFAVIAFDNGAGDGSAMRRRLEAGFDRFVPIAALGAKDAAARVAAEDIDLLINLNGYFGRMRMDLFAQRPAPLAVNFLGFPGTLGTAAIDYLVADRHVVPPDEAPSYVEKIAWLPHSYQIQDDRRARPPQDQNRAAHGLPPEAFVFCHFNQGYKLTPESFAVWMRILAAVENSVLWLLDSGPLFAANLRRQAAAAGIAPQRLVFAPYVAQAPHLARLALGDLFLDGLPCNAHTTASDALWMGLPLLTCRGRAFSGRVAASLLSAAGLPELIVQSWQDYEKLAVTLAHDPARLAALKTRLAAAPATAPLFDTDRYRRDLETAYGTMLEGWERGAPPQSFAVP